MKNLFFISLIFFILTSCGKNKEVKIIAKNAATGTPYSGLSFRVMSSKTGMNGEKYRTEASGELNANGEAIVSIKQKTGRTYSVIVNEPSNSCYNKQITQYFDSKYDVDGVFTFEFAECAYFKLSIANLNCGGQTDIMKFRSRYSYTDWESWSSNRLGCYTLNSTEYLKVNAGWRIYETSVTRSSGTTIIKDSIYVSPNSYTDFQINY